MFSKILFSSFMENVLRFSSGLGHAVETGTYVDPFNVKEIVIFLREHVSMWYPAYENVYTMYPSKMKVTAME